MGQMEGKVIIVTGSASGLGRAISIYAGKLSAIVVATDINLEGAQETKRQIDASGGISEVLQTDVTIMVNANGQWGQVLNYKFPFYFPSS